VGELGLTKEYAAGGVRVSRVGATGAINEGFRLTRVGGIGAVTAGNIDPKVGDVGGVNAGASMARESTP